METTDELNVEMEDSGEIGFIEAEGNETLFVQEGQLVIPFTGHAVVLQDDQGNFQQYIINEGKVDDEPIIYYTQDYAEVSGVEIAPEQLPEPLYQYAILSNGKLHLKTDQLAFDQMDEMQPDEASLNLENITGKNLVTGQTVTLDSYFDKLHQRLDTDTKINVKKSTSIGDNELINRKVIIGKTSDGKKIVGKILHVQTNKTADFEENNVKENVIDTVCQPQFIIKKHVVSRENFDSNIGKTLSGLMDLETVQHKLRDKNLVVKLVDKVFAFGADSFTKTISYVYGHMQLLDAGDGQQKWCFALQNEPREVDDDNDNGETDVSLPIEDSSATASLTILTVTDRNGKRSTRVNLNPQEPRNKCQFCSREFKSTLKLRNHISNMHLSDNWASCDICGKSFTNASFLQRHKKIHTGNKWYQCPKCPKSFSSAGSLKRHVTVHDPSLRPLECSICVQRFTDESSLKKHLLIHTGIRAYVCDMCNRAFRNQGDLNFHRKIHDPVKQFSCDVCGRAFSRHSNMLRHAEIHRGSGALHQCHLCGCSYSFISSLTRHIVQKHISEQQS